MKQRSSHELIPKLIVMPMELLLDKYSEDGSHRRYSEKDREKVVEENAADEADETALSATQPC
ncbi:hypothetical protein D3C77_772400 [compost metagenome]